jgi:hypothetical protein
MQQPRQKHNKRMVVIATLKTKELEWVENNT